MKALTAVLVDDEAPGRALLRACLAEQPGIEIVAECANGFDAVKAVQEKRPDLLFLDVQMPRLDGFEVLELIGDAAPPAVVFVTAWDQHALRAFEAHAVDYLLKPFTAERLGVALERVRQRLATPRPPAAEVAAAARAPNQYATRIVVRDGGRISIIPVEQLDYAAAQDDYVELTAGGQRHLKQQTLAGLAGTLDPARFVRIHRGWLLNLERLARLEPLGKESHVAVLRDGTRLPVSRGGLGRLQAALES